MAATAGPASPMRSAASPRETTPQRSAARSGPAPLRRRGTNVVENPLHPSVVSQFELRHYPAFWHWLSSWCNRRGEGVRVLTVYDTKQRRQVHSLAMAPHSNLLSA